MQVTLRELLTAKMFSSSRVFAGSEGLSRQVVSMCIVADDNGLHYLNESMLAIVCGMFLTLSPNEYADYMRKMAEKNVAGIMIKPWYYRPEVLDAIRKTGNELKLPVITMEDNDYAFYDFYTFANTNVYCRGERVFISLEEVAARLTQKMHGTGLPELCEQLNSWTGLTTTWVSQSETRCFSTDGTGSSLICGLDEKECLMRAKLSRNYSELMELPQQSGIPALGVMLSYSDKTIGFIWLEPAPHAFDENDAQLLRAVKLVCELEMQKVLLYEQETAKTKARFVESLLSGKISSYSEAELVSSGLGWRIPPELQVLCAKCTDAADLYLQMDAVLSHAAQALKTHVVVQPYGGCIAILLPCGEDVGQSAYALLSVLNSRWHEHQFALGVGRPTPLQYAHKSYAEALYALSNGYLITNKPIVFFAKMGYFRLFCPSVLPDELIVYCREKLLPLFESEQNTQLDLLNTLRAYNRAQGNYKLAGEELFVHPNTVRYRMQVIEEICGISFKNEDELFSMRLALQLLPKAFPERAGKDV